MSATERILAWAEDRPPWQRHALGRLAMHRELPGEELDGLFAMLKVAHGLDVAGGFSEPVPLSPEHLPETAESDRDMRLVAVSDVGNAGQLKSGETLDFAMSGLTLIYGDNGSGKSGYTRVLKRACRARAENRLLPNVFDAGWKSKPSATAKVHIAWISSDGGQVEETLDWTDDAPTTPDALSRVRVFDAKTAALYVTEKSALAYVPFNLDLIELLGRVCDSLRLRVEEEKKQQLRRVADLLKAFPPGTPSWTYARGLTADTSADDVTTAARWDEESDAASVTRIEKLLADPGAVAEAVRRVRSRCAATRVRLSAHESALSDDAVSKYRAAVTAVSEARIAAERLSNDAFSREPLPGVGAGPWRMLWEAARRFSTETAYRGREFPVVDPPEPRCVLCLQELHEEARDRMGRFRDFVEGVVTQNTRDAEATLRLHSETIDQLRPLDAADMQLAEDLTPLDGPLGEDLAANITETRTRRDAVAHALASGEFEELPAVGASAVQRLVTLEATLDARAAAAAASVEPEERTRLELELADLRLRRTLHAGVVTLHALREVHSETAKLEACMKALNPRAITEAKKALDRDFITRPFVDALEEEGRELGVGHKVTLGFSVERGATQHVLRFAEADCENVGVVLSEGEHRAIALACFLAEARQLPGSPPIVIDDPVSSLDHLRRSAVAKRLVKEAAARQVVVFTHDLVFYAEMMSQAAEAQIPVRCHAVRRVREGCGKVDREEAPWVAKNVTARLHWLEHVELPRLRRLDEARDSDYGAQVKLFGEQLRETWERLIEEELFAQVVLRYRPGVETLRLDEVSVSHEAWQNVFWGMTRTSALAHDAARAVGSAAPSTEGLKAEIDRIRDGVVRIVRERDETRKARKALKTAPRA